MEVPGGAQNKLLVCLHEALGTCLLFCAVNMSAGQEYQAYAVGLVLMVSIVLLGPISNSHVNPAVTLGVLIRESGEERAAGKLGHNAWYGVRIMLSQVFGAILGACVITMLRYSKDGKSLAMARLCGAIGDGDCEDAGAAGAKMLLAEFIGTFLFVSVNVNIIYNNGSKDLVLNAMIIGFALTLGLMVAAPISGASINPAVGLVLPIFQHIVHDVKMSQIWIHALGPFLGGLFAGLFQLFYKSSLRKIQDAATQAEAAEP